MNATLVRDAFDAINRGDWDAAFAHAGADFVYDLSRTESPLRGVHRGDDARRVAAEFFGMWESVRYEVHDVIDLGDRVVTPYTSRFRGRDGIELVTGATWLWRFRDGRVCELTLYPELEQALAA